MSLPTPSGGRIAIGIVLSIVVVIVGSVAWGFTQQITRAKQMRTEEIRLEQTVTAKQAHYDDMVTRLDYIRSDEYVEKWAREDMRMAKPGEVVVIFVDDASTELPANPQPSPTPEPEPKPFWEDLWDLFTPADE